MRKYKFTGETKNWCGSALHRIQRVSNGELGGWLEKESNLSQEGNCWVSGNARVYGDSWVYGNAQVSGDARVSGNAQVFGNAQVEKTSDYVVYQTNPYSVTITKQTISIGCEVRSRFGNEQWKTTDPEATAALIKQYKPIVSFLKKQLPRQQAK